MSTSLPDFERPPISEVAIGVQFEPLAKLRVAHFGIYWLRIRNRYPTAEDQVPLPANIMQTLPAKPNQVPAIAFHAGLMPPRCCFLDPAGNELVQFQKDRFIRNWRQTNGDEPYPRFPCLMRKFTDEWEEFLSFIKAEDLGETKVSQCELSYVNHLEPGSGWKDYSDLARVFTVLQAPGAGFLPEPELQGWESRYKLPENRGVLLAKAQPVFRGAGL